MLEWLQLLQRVACSNYKPRHKANGCLLAQVDQLFYNVIRASEKTRNQVTKDDVHVL